MPAAVLLVDDDGAQSRNAQYTSISAAVAAASAGDTIRVFAGTYEESVTVTKTLRIETVRGRGTVIVDPGTLGAGFDVQANNVKISGFTIEGAVGNPGISLSRTFSGYDIQHNTLQDNTFGLYLNSDGALRTTIKNNSFLRNNEAGAASGNGIYSDQGVSNVRIDNNLFTGQQNAAMIFVGNGTTAQDQFNLRIFGNDLYRDAPIIMINTHDSQINSNLSVESSGSGIFFGGGVHDVQVFNNRLRDGAFTGINLRTDTINYPVSTPNSNNLIKNNRISGFGDSGLRLRDGAFENRVENNLITANGVGGDATTGDGISLENAQNNLIRNNRVERNRRDGIRVDVNSRDNFIERNLLRHNNEHDAHDDSTGSGTAGTANTWNNNSGLTETPTGLLKNRR